MMSHSTVYRMIIVFIFFFLFIMLFIHNEYYIPPWVVFKRSHISVQTKTLPRFDSTLLLKAATIDSREMLIKEEIEELLKETNFLSAGSSSTSLSERILEMSDEYKDWFEFKRECKEWHEFKRVLKDWAGRRIYQPDLMIELVRLVKHPLDKYNHGLSNSYKKYESCAVVGNGKQVLSNKENGDLIDTHEFVIRVENARVEGFHNIMGSKTSISFISSNILNECAVNHDACSSCQPYGLNVPTIMNIHQPAHLLDYIKCNSSHRAPLLVTDGRLDVLISRIAKYYSLKRFIDEQSDKAVFFKEDYIYDEGGVVASPAMRAVMLAVGVCDQVSLFGVQTNNGYFPSDQSYVTGSHDYQAEYELYHDLVNNPLAIPFISDKLEFPPVAIWQ